MFSEELKKHLRSNRIILKRVNMLLSQTQNIKNNNIKRRILIKQAEQCLKSMDRLIKGFDIEHKKELENLKFHLKIK